MCKQSLCFLIHSGQGGKMEVYAGNCLCLFPLTGMGSQKRSGLLYDALRLSEKRSALTPSSYTIAPLSHPSNHHLA